MIKLNRIAAAAVVTWASGPRPRTPLLPSADSAQSYPNRPLRRIVSGFPAGGPIDTIARALGEKLSQSMGQPFLVENVPGAAGQIGTDRVAKSTADGYTLLVGASTIPIHASLYKSLPYDTLRDFQPLTQTTSGPQILVVPSSLPVKSVQEFVVLAKAKPGTMNFSSAGIGVDYTSGDLSSATGTDIVHALQRTDQALTDVIAGRRR
jgi:tripartite-type tricarboxylate transporter receptor subunit TctC